jgi:stage II sporulation protein E
MLGATMSKTTSIKMLNNFLRYKDGECSSTVDLFEFDTLTGKASFVKSGAAPSIVKRGGGIFRIKSQTMPIGLLSSIDAEKTDLSLREGDTVIMLSDGISQSCDEKWLLSAIAEANIYTSPKEMATHILKEAKKNSQKADDMTVAVIKISSLLPARDISEIKDSVSAV